MDADLVMQVLRALEREQVRYKVVGGVALNLHGLPRATQDIDLFVAPDEENVARLRRALHAVFEDASIDEITASDLLGHYPAIQYVPPAGRFHVDILSRLGEAYGFEDIEANPCRIGELEVPVATPRMLFLMKRDTVRPQDRADAARLRDHFDLED